MSHVQILRYFAPQSNVSLYYGKFLFIFLCCIVINIKSVTSGDVREEQKCLTRKMTASVLELLEI